MDGDGKAVKLFGSAQDITENKRAEKALRESEEKFRHLFDHSPIGKTITYVSGEMQSNKTLAEMLGYSQNEFRNFKWQDITHPDDIYLSQSIIDSVISGGKEFVRFTKRYIHKNGAIVWADGSTKLQRDSEGAPLYFITAVIDITERKRIEEQIKISEQKFRNLAENVPGLVLNYKLNPDGSDELLYISKSVEDIFEVSQEDSFNNNKLLWDRIHKDDLEEYIISIKTSAEKLSLWEQEHRIQLPGDRIKWLYTRGVPFQQDDGCIIWDTIALDITERKQAEEALRESQNILNIIGQMAKIGGWELYPETMKVTWTDETYRIHELPKTFNPPLEEAINFWHPEDQPILRKAIKKALDDGIPYDLELRFITAKGKNIYARTKCNPVLRNGKVVKLQGFFHDITERKQAEESIKKNESIQRKMVANIGDVIVIIDQDGINRYKSPNIEKLFGWKPEEVVGSSTWENVHPDDIESTQKFFRNLIREPGIVGTTECRYRCKNGSYRWIEFTGSNLLHDPDINGLLGNYHDITERKKIEVSRTKREALFRGLYDNMTSGSAIYEVINDGSKGSDYIIKNFNEKSLEIEGKTLDQVVGKSLYDLRPTIDDYGLIPVMKKVWETGKSDYFPIKIYEDKKFSNYYENYIFKIPTGELVTIYNDVTDQKNSEIALIESEKRFSLAMEFANDGIFDWNLETNEIYYSPGWKRMLGYEDDELPNDFTVWESLTKPEDVKRSWKMQNELINKKRDRFEIEFKMKHKDGHWVDILSRANAIFNEDDKAVRVVGTHQDVTEKKKAEERLKKSKQIIESASDAIISTDLNGIITFWNSGAEKLYGYKNTEVLNKPIKLIYKDKDLPVLENLITDLIEKKDLSSVEVTCIDKDGNDVDTLLSLMTIKNENQDVIELVGFTKDIRELKKYEREIKKEKERAERYLNLAGVIFVAINQKGDVTLINQKGCETLGYKYSEIIEKNWFENFIPEWLRDDLIPVSKQLLNGDIEPIKYYENPILTKTGEEKLIAWHNTILKDEEGYIIGHLSAGEDITEKRKMEEQLQQAQKMESVGRLAGGVAHDFNNMLNIILGNTEMAIEDIAQDHPVHGNLGEILSAAKHSADITRQLLAFSRKQTIAPKVLNLNDTIESMLRMLRRLIGEDIDLAWLPGANISQVRMDPSQIDQILANLCVNARDAIADVGKIAIETGNTNFDSAYCETHLGFKTGDFVLLAVSDDGCGMDKDTMKNLFEPFYTTKEVGKGTGLGLATVYGIVKQNDGFINVYSEPDQGTTFRIYLPQYRAETEIPEKKTADKIDMDGNETILLVEDEPPILKMTRMMLERMGYKVFAAGTPGEAIALAREHVGEIHMLMTDVVMPEMNGRDLAKNILSLHPNIKRLFMSGYTANVIAHHGVLDEGVNFIQKPFSKQDLAIKIREVLDEAKS